MRRTQEIAQRTARDPIFGKGIAFEFRDRVEIVENRRANDKAAFVHCGVRLRSCPRIKAVTPARIDKSILAFAKDSV
jgi:hypothetical protein